MTMKLDELVRKYIQIREKRSRLKVEYEEKVAPYVEAQDRIEAMLLSLFGELGVDSVKTSEGTAYTATRVSVTVADWDAFLAFVKTNDAYEMIERRVSKTAVEQYKAANEDLPPGVNWSETRVVNFRRA